MNQDKILKDISVLLSQAEGRIKLALSGRITGLPEAQIEVEKAAVKLCQWNETALPRIGEPEGKPVLPPSEIAGKIAEPLTQIDKITIIGGDNSNGVSTVADNVPGVMTKLFETMKETVGIDLSEIVKSETYDAKVNRNINFTGLSGQEKEKIAAAVSEDIVSDISNDSKEV